MMRNLFYIVLFSSLVSGCHPLSKEGDKQPTPEQNLPGIILKTVSGNDTTLSEIIHHKTSVFIFLSPDCPLSQSYSLTLNEFSETYFKNNICFYGVFPGSQYTAEQIKDFQKKYAVVFPLLRDTAYALTNLFNATITPEAFVADSTGHVLYSGRIDNWAYEVSKKRQLITEHDLQNALDCIVSNKPVIVAKTQAIGCFIEPPKK